MLKVAEDSYLILIFVKHAGGEEGSERDWLRSLASERLRPRPLACYPQFSRIQP
jgi:hypothetical protein